MLSVETKDLVIDIVGSVGKRLCLQRESCKISERKELVAGGQCPVVSRDRGGEADLGGSFSKNGARWARWHRAT